jgi:hypothetical protein
MNDHSATHQLSGSEEVVAYLLGDNFTDSHTITPCS